MDEKRRDEKRRSGGACTRRPGQRWQPRKEIRLPSECYLGGEPFLLTVCAAGRRALLTDECFGREAYQAMPLAAAKTGATLWCGVVMPDHAHLLVTALDGKSPLDVGSYFKRLVTIEARKLGHSGALWQRRVHDRGIRADFNHDPAAVIRYVLDHPVRQGLVSSPERWPFSHLHPELGLTP